MAMRRDYEDLRVMQLGDKESLFTPYDMVIAAVQNAEAITMEVIAEIVARRIAILNEGNKEEHGDNEDARGVEEKAKDTGFPRVAYFDS